MIEGEPVGPFDERDEELYEDALAMVEALRAATDSLTGSEPSDLAASSVRRRRCGAPLIARLAAEVDRLAEEVEAFRGQRPLS